jgi:hypothetical protein
VSEAIRHSATLARISRGVPTAAANPIMATVLRSSGRLAVSVKYACGAFNCVPCIHVRPRRLFTNFCKKCGQGLQGSPFHSISLPVSIPPGSMAIAKAIPGDSPVTKRFAKNCNPALPEAQIIMPIS